MHQDPKEQNFKYFAFISYSSKDLDWGKRLQRRLEHYKMPATICSEHGWQRRPMNPIFFAPTDIQPGCLSEELKKRLRESRHLIVICSPASARSQWVAKEIEYFHDLGRSSNLHLFIVEGNPGCGEDNCINPVIADLGIPEILGVNVHEKISRLPWLNKERAYVQLITKLLNVEFDSIWQRHKRQRKIQFASCVAGVCLTLLAMIGIRQISLPADVSLYVTELTPPALHLPEMSDAAVSMYLGDEVRSDTIASLGNCAVFHDIHRKYLGKPVRVTVTCDDYVPKDTIMVLEKDMSLGIARDMSYYGAVRFRLYHPDRIMAGCHVRVGEFDAVSDDKGYVSIDIPLEHQRTAYPVSADVPLVDDFIIMPTNSTSAIEVK